VGFYTELKRKILDWWYVKIMSVHRRVKTGIFPSLEIGTKNQNFLEN